MLPGRYLTFVVPLALSASLAFAQASSSAYGAESPQAAVAGVQKAIKSDDVAAAMLFITPAGRREMATEGVSGILLVLASNNPDDQMSGGAPLPKAELAARRKRYKSAVDAVRRALKPHGLDRAIGRPVMAPGTQTLVDNALAKADTVVLMRALLSTMDQVGPTLGMSKGDRPRVPFALGTVSGYKVDGERATARAGRDTLEFQRIDARWYIRPLSPGTR